MKNPFKKNDHIVAIAGIVIGTVAVGAAAYLFFTETGSPMRERIAAQFDRIRTAILGVSEDEER